jgi:hypothetical protein
MDNLDLRRRALRAQLQTQRQLLANHLYAEDHNPQYPRSMTMRFLTHQSGLKVIAEVATVFLGARILKSLSSALAVAKILQTVAGRRGGLKPH